MNTQKEKIKLNIPCSICNKELFLGTGLVSFGDERTPVHLECYNKAGKSEQKAKTKEIIEKLFPNEESKYYGIKLDYDKFKQLLQELEKSTGEKNSQTKQETTKLRKKLPRATSSEPSLCKNSRCSPDKPDCIQEKQSSGDKK